MRTKEWKAKAYELLEQLGEHLQEIPIRGTTSTECQRTNIQITLNELDSKINGVEIEDFFEEGIELIRHKGQIKKLYADSDVTSGEFIFSLAFDVDYGKAHIREDLQEFLDWDDSDEEFQIVYELDYYSIEPK